MLTVAALLIILQLKQLSADNVTSEEVLSLLSNMTSPKAGPLVAGDLVLSVSGMTQLLDKQNETVDGETKKNNLKVCSASFNVSILVLS